MELPASSFQTSTGFGQPDTFNSMDGAMDVEMRDDMDIDLTIDADIVEPEAGAVAQVG
jgi:hypothetical protein